jgi:uncharacterized protein YegP (UPF0339 family)
MELNRISGSRLAGDRRREPAESHFRRLNKTDAPPGESADKTSCKFEIYRADEVRMTSTRFCGGDWHWRLSDAEGLILLDTGGYSSERECRSAIAVLQEHAGFATVSRTI